jgi:type IV pilus assembly protein PilQ
VQGVPYLSRMPVLGWLFKNKSETVSKQELLIFLTPSIIKT